MANFFTANRSDTKQPVLINIDAIEHVDDNGKGVVPPLEDFSALSPDLLGTVTVHFIGDEPLSPSLSSLADGTIKLDVDFDRFQTLVKSADTAEKIASERKAALQKMTADRQKERDKANQQQVQSEERAAKKQRKARTPKAPKAAKAPRKARKVK